MIGAFRWILSRLVSERERVPAVERVARGALLVPVFGLMLVYVRAVAWLAGPPRRPATVRYGARFDCLVADFVQSYIYLFGIWEPDITAFTARRLAPGDTFIDVGANVGYHTLLAAGIVGDAGRVVAVEPSPRIRAELRANLARNGSPACVREVDKAASDTPGKVTIYLGPEKNLGLTTTVKSRGLAEETLVDAAPLADLLEPDEIAAARLVKIDVEGAEDVVVRGMAGFLASCAPDVEILLELSPKWWADGRQTAQDVLRPLVEAGFHVYKIDNNLWPWRYLWPNDVRRPRRVREPLTKRVWRLDLVLSRIDAPEL